MIPSRRACLMGAAALSAAVATPEMTRAAAALNAVDRKSFFRTVR